MRPITWILVFCVISAPLQAGLPESSDIQRALFQAENLSHGWRRTPVPASRVSTAASFSCPALQLTCLVIDTSSGASTRESVQNYSPTPSGCKAQIRHPYSPFGVDFYAEFNDDFSLTLKARQASSGALFSGTEFRVGPAAPGKWYKTNFWDAHFTCVVRPPSR